jgi:hypothetical protein
MHVLFARNKWLKVSEGTYTAGALYADLTTANAFAAPADLSAYQDGNHILWANDGTNTLMAWISATAPGGETLGADIFSGFNFTSGWTKNTGSETIIDANSFSTTAAGGLQKNVMTVGSLYKLVFARATTATLADAYNGATPGTRIVFGTGSGTFYSTAREVTFFLRNSTAGQTDVSTMELYNVTDCAATGALLLSTKGGARGFISLPSAFNGNLAGTYRILRSY